MLFSVTSQRLSNTIVIFRMSSIFCAVITYLAIPIYACNVFGNLLVILVLQKNKKLCSSPNTALLLALAHSDLWFSIFAFVNIIVLANQIPFMYFEFFLNALASIYIYVALAVERYFAILKPFVHMRRATKSLLCKILVTIYILAVSLSAPGHYFGNVRKYLEYSRGNTTKNATTSAPVLFETLSTVYSFVLLVFGLVLPSAVIVFCYSRVIYHVWFNANENRATNAGLLKSRRKLTKLFILLTVVFMITWTPTFARLMVTQYGVRNSETLKFDLISILLGLVGSTVNPVIFSLRCPRFRQEVVKLFTCRCCKRKIRPTGAGITLMEDGNTMKEIQSTRGQTVQLVSVTFR